MYNFDYQANDLAVNAVLKNNFWLSDLKTHYHYYVWMGAFKI